ncbi:hypothetical protein K438DRAFT_1972314 [Mycena galopus ATCC 62051]|nr:hypothetical protein K438DRAFT_1972314 [Mycena galopus ATCC 62051]
MKHGLTLLAEKVERVAAHIHRFRKKDVYQMQELEAACDTILKATDDSSVLPSSIYVPVNGDGGWAKTKSVMTHMPKVKMVTKRDGKDAYGGGKASGSKAKGEDGVRLRKRARKASPVDLQPEA